MGTELDWTVGDIQRLRQWRSELLREVPVDFSLVTRLERHIDWLEHVMLEQATPLPAS